MKVLWKMAGQLSLFCWFIECVAFGVKEVETGCIHFCFQSGTDLNIETGGQSQCHCRAMGLIGGDRSGCYGRSNSFDARPKISLWQRSIRQNDRDDFLVAQGLYPGHINYDLIFSREGVVAGKGLRPEAG